MSYFSFFLCFDSFAGQLQPADPDFYRIGFARMVRAYGVEFKEGPDGYGVFASRDVEPLRRARVGCLFYLLLLLRSLSILCFFTVALYLVLVLVSCK